MSAAASTARNIMVGKLNAKNSVVLLCDMQERFRPLIWRMETVVNTCRYVTSVAKALDIPIVSTQQYTKVFGATLPDCFSSTEAQKEVPVFEKKKFSMITEPVAAHLEGLRNSGDGDGGDSSSSSAVRSSYLVVGIEAHVCVQQTCLDLLERGDVDVHVIVDGVSSQQAMDRQVALQRLSAAGAYLTTAQSAAFMLMQSAEHPNFKAVSKLTVEHMKLPNEFNEAILKHE